MDIEAKIRSLKKKEAATLFLICCGQTNPEISESLKEPFKTTSSRITRIYKKLEITGDDQEKRIILLRDYCPVVRKIITNLDTLRYWVPTYPTTEVKVKYEIIEVENPEEEEDDSDDVDKWLLPLPPGPQTKQLLPLEKEPGSKPIRLITEKELRRRNWILVSIIVVLIGLVVYLLFRGPNPIFPIASANTTPTGAPTITLTNFAAVTEAPTLATTPAPIHTDTPPPTETPAPTQTEVPSPTITGTATSTPTPTPEIIFFDDFSNDLSQWTILGLPPGRTNNTVHIANEALTTTDAYGTWVVADIPAETNYQIIINFQSGGCGGSSNYFSPAFTDTFHMIAFIASACSRSWGFTDGNGYTQTYSGTVGGNGPGVHHLVLTVKGKKLSAVLNEMDAGSVVNENYDQGKIGIFVETNALIYDVMAIRLSE